jgi:CHAT domain-containing protein
MDAWLAFAFRNLGVVHLRLNQFEQSLHHYSSALGLAYRLRNESIVLGAHENIGVALEKLGRIGEARNFYHEAMRWQESFIQEGTEQAEPALAARRLNLLYKQGNLALEMNDLAAAESFFQDSLESSSKRGMKELAARDRIGLAQVYLRQKRLNQATDELRKVPALTAAGGYPELEWQAQTVMGSVLKAQGDNRAALVQFERSIETLEKIGRTISSTDFRQTYLNQRFDPYGETVSLSYHFQNDRSKTLDYVERAKSVRLQAYLEASQHRAGQSSPAAAWTGSARMAGAIPTDFTTLEYFLAAGELFIFISGEGRLDAVALPISASELELQVQSYLKSIKSNDRVSFEAQSRKFYDQLVKPALSRLDRRKIETLIIIPDGPLHRLPFSGLKDSEGRYLIESHALAYAPSRRILHYCLSLGKANAGGNDRSLLLLDGSANLAGASDELAHLTRLYPRKTSLIGSGDLSALRRNAGEFEIIQFSGHAATPNGKPSLVFSSGATPNYLDASVIGNWNLHKNRLVNLAGCNTGVGPSEEGMSSWGLLPAFLNAGAPALMVSLLPVDDRATGKLTSLFYDLLARGSTAKTKALQQAQIALLRDNRPELNAPVSWIPFVLVGDPR